MKDFVDGYIDLFRHASTKDFSPAEYTRFVAIRGEQYNTLESKDFPRLMIIGRAVNGWDRENLIYESEDAFAQSAKNCFCDSNRFSSEWHLQSRQNGEYYSTTADIKYYLSQSPFWNYSKHIWKELVKETEIADELDWLQYIVWSNLYKVSPRYGGNPNNVLCKTQAPACIAILDAEIRLLKPTHILMPVSDSWFTWRNGDFSQIFAEGHLDLRELTPKELLAQRISLDQQIIKHVFVGESMKVVVTNRPERRKQERYVNEVINAFRCTD